jgi:Na+/H+ antiporter NhaC
MSGSGSGREVRDPSLLDAVVPLVTALLGVSTGLYLPYACFNIFSPVLSVLYGFTGFKITKVEPTVSPAG